MSKLGQIVKEVLSPNSKRNNIERAYASQIRTLKRLLLKAGDTEFGKYYHFSEILFSDSVNKNFRNNVPLSNYSLMFPWWQKAYDGEKSVTWPGKVKYFALSSGTSEGASKYIPVTKSMLKAITRGSTRQLLKVAQCKDVPKDIFNKHYVMIGGSTSLQYNGFNFSGDLSGITTSNIPFWFEPLTKPEPQIRAVKNWQEKIDEILNNAPNWDPGMIAGVPAWIKLLFEKIIEKYNLNNIHDIWPHLTVFSWGGVSIEPYRKSIDALCGKPLHYFETYLASEGFIAFQDHENASGMKLILNNGIYYEFVPFNENNFDSEGNLLDNAKALNLREVEEGIDYALAISTCSGAWRYLIGDTIRFTNLNKIEIKITGRTKHYLSICGEHLSVDNMNTAVNAVSAELNTITNEFTVLALTDQDNFGHEWYIGSSEKVSEIDFQKLLDTRLGELNDDYLVERKHALKKMIVHIIPNEWFVEFLGLKGKEGGQTKFPRVLKGQIVEEWKSYIVSKLKNNDN